MATGFPALNTFRKKARRLAQLYDFTAGLYLEELPKLKIARRGAKPRDSMHTSLGTITHSVNALYEYAKDQFPNRLRSLVLISLVAQFEAFLTDLITEIADRDLSPFADSQPVEIPRGRLFTTPSIQALQESILEKDRRALTSGGLEEFAKYFNRRFQIDFKTLGISYKTIRELHARRHLHVHSDGVVDHQYLKEFPTSGATVGERLNVDHSYILSAFQLSIEFASAIALAATKSFPTCTRAVKSQPGRLSLHTGSTKICMIAIEIDKSPQPTPQQILAIPLPASGRIAAALLGDYTLRIIYKDRVATLTIGADDDELRWIMYHLRQVPGFTTRFVGAV